VEFDNRFELDRHAEGQRTKSHRSACVHAIPSEDAREDVRRAIHHLRMALEVGRAVHHSEDADDALHAKPSSRRATVRAAVLDGRLAA